MVDNLHVTLNSSAPGSYITLLSTFIPLYGDQSPGALGKVAKSNNF